MDDGAEREYDATQSPVRSNDDEPHIEDFKKPSELQSHLA